MIPRLMDFPYLEPIFEVFRLEEVRFSSYPQAPQLPKREKEDIVISVKKKKETENKRRHDQRFCSMSDLGTDGFFTLKGE